VEEHALGAATPVRDSTGKTDLLDAESADELGLLDGIDRIADQPVHVGGRESRIGERGHDRICGQLRLAATGSLRELRLAHADDRGRVTQSTIHRPSPWA
jgi:hypothetical protein